MLLLHPLKEDLSASEEEDLSTYGVTNDIKLIW